MHAIENCELERQIKRECACASDYERQQNHNCEEHRADWVEPGLRKREVRDKYKESEKRYCLRPCAEKERNSDGYFEDAKQACEGVTTIHMLPRRKCEEDGKCDTQKKCCEGCEKEDLREKTEHSASIPREMEDSNSQQEILNAYLMGYNAFRIAPTLGRGSDQASEWKSKESW